MKDLSEETLRFHKEFTRQEPLSQTTVKRVVEILESGRLHRYNTVRGEIAEASLLEKEYADYVGTKYCVGFSSCGSAIYVALKSVGVQSGDKVLSNAFTLAPVPGAIKNAGAEPVFVEITEDYVTDLNDLEKKAKESKAKFFLLSHMRGHIVDMEKLLAICDQHGIVVVEDCAHTMGATWDGKFTGTYGKVGCFSTQTYKHLNSGEGGLLVSDDPDVAAQAILYSGSYMLYEKHIARPELEVFEKYKKLIPNFSLRMSNLVAAMIRVQLPNLERQGKRWNERYQVIENELVNEDTIYLPNRPEKEGYISSSFQFTLKNTTVERVKDFINTCMERGVEIKWFGSLEPKGFTSRYESWEYFGLSEQLPQTSEILNFMCDFRLPLTFTLEDCKIIAQIIKQVAREKIV